ncbi:uncharacterized protein LOC125852329 [Solanum stenotomum]|uniref:uncharacterized protein LOC125852329 n=1 Tax=Solanum stenotomum TaxID=172797 RepID=UPI0020D1C3D6|nr:uncharacterized protein LOC125852329 [Solanum stenotomum]
MENAGSFSAMAPPVFDEETYQAWAVKMKVYLEAISATIFSRIMTCNLAKAIWDFLKKEYEGDERIRGMKVLNLVREFEIQRMKESKTIKDYSDRLLGIANKAQEQRIMMRHEGSIEGALKAKLQFGSSAKGNKGKGKKGNHENYEATTATNDVTATSNNREGKYPPCQHCGRKNHPHFKCWRKPDMKCRKCHKLSYAEIICKEKGLQQPNDAQIADQQKDEQLFVATCFTSINSSESWLVDSGCTNHMTSDEKLFRELDKSVKSRVRIGNGEYLPAKGKGTVAIEIYKGKKFFLEFIERGTHSFSKPAHCSGNVTQKVGSLSSQSFIVYAKEQNGKWFTKLGGEPLKL